MTRERLKIGMFVKSENTQYFDCSGYECERCSQGLNFEIWPVSKNLYQNSRILRINIYYFCTLVVRILGEFLRQLAVWCGLNWYLSNVPCFISISLLTLWKRDFITRIARVKQMLHMTFCVLGHDNIQIVNGYNLKNVVCLQCSNKVRDQLIDVCS